MRKYSEEVITLGRKVWIQMRNKRTTSLRSMV
jgi:hypothetical protein